jgi:hypothetical protein
MAPNRGCVQISETYVHEAFHCDLTSAISGGAQSARRLLIETFGSRMPWLQAA